METPNQPYEINTTPFWRDLVPLDIPLLIPIASTIHPSLPESPSVFLERIALFPSGCLALVSPVTHELLGYAISHPIHQRRPPPLDTILGQIAEDADQYYIHDVALLPEVRGTGLAQRGVEILLANARERGFESTGLVSVYGTKAFWGRFGFGEIEESGFDGTLRTKLEAYGDDAVFLERRN